MVRERSDGRWEGRIELGWENGRRKQKTVYAKTKRDLLVKMREAATTHAQGLPQPSETLTVEKFVRQWLEDVVKPRVRPLTYVAYKSKSENHILPAIGKMRLVRLTPEDVQRFLNQKVSEGLSPRTVREFRAVLRTRCRARSRPATFTATSPC